MHLDSRTTPIATLDLQRGARIGRMLDRMTIAFVGLGIVARAIQFLWRRSYWHDEAALVLNVFSKTASELLVQLDFEQAAPPVFLLAERAMHVLFGRSEFALRAVPLLCGMASLALFGWLARRWLAPAGACLAVAMFAMSETIIWHATEAKPYAGDILATTVLLAIALRTQPSARTMIILSSLAGTLCWLSYPVVFVFAGISLAMLPAISAPRLRRIGLYILVNAPAVIGFALMYWTSIRHQQSAGLSLYWQGDMADWSRPWTVPWWAVDAAASLATYPLGPMGLVMLPLAILGAIAMWFSSGAARRELAILALPIAMTLIAALAEQYPFEGSRLTVFLAPCLFLLAGRGTVALMSRVRAPRDIWPLAIPASLIVAALPMLIYRFFIPQTRYHIRPAIEYVRAHMLPGDVIVVTDRHGRGEKTNEFRCYWRDDAGARVLTDIDSIETGGPGRYWLIVSFTPHRASRALHDIKQEVSDDGTVQRDEFIVHGGAAFLFEKG